MTNIKHLNAKLNFPITISQTVLHFYFAVLGFECVNTFSEILLEFLFSEFGCFAKSTNIRFTQKIDVDLQIFANFQTPSNFLLPY